MLTGEQVLDMLAAGFTAEEIRNFSQPEPEQQETQPEPQQELEPQPEPEPQHEQQIDYVGREEFDSLKTSIENLTKTIQANNILHASKDTPAKTLTPDEAADVAIKAFFNA